MKNTFLLCWLMLILFSASAQTTTENKKTNIIKIGTFFLNDLYYSYDHYDYDYYTRYQTTSPSGYFYGAFEHIIDFAGGKAISYEPKLGVMLQDGKTGFFAGNDLKYFWKNTPFYRLGVSLYLGYRYINREKEETLSMENGMYQQIVRYNSNNHYFDTEISLIPFQFTFSKSGIILESNVGFGVTWRTEKPDETNLSNEIIQQLDDTSVYPYFPKIGLKLGYIIR